MASSGALARRKSAEDELAVRHNLDPHTSFLYMPHTVTFLFVGVAGLVWYSGALAPQPPNEGDPRAALLACACVYLGYSTLQGPSSVMIRPHPTVWRFWHGVCMLYLLVLVHMLIIGKDASRRLLANVDSSLGKPLDEREYGGDCRLYIPGEGWNLATLKATIFDEFVIAHTLGWWVKALIMRNWLMLWTCSIGFELMELTFQHWLLNFNECWWDSWILDVAMCNLGGMVAGMWTVKYFGSKKYDWQGLSQQKGVLKKAKRGLLQFTPHTLEVWDWASFSSPLRLFQTLFLVALILAFELNAFFLKTLLWVPPPNLLNVLRLALLGLLALPGVKEYHEWLNSDNQNVFTKLGPYAWLCGAILCTEILIIIKFGRDEFSAPFPEHIKIFWGIVGAVIAAVLIGWQGWIWGRQYLQRVSPEGQAGAQKKRT